jgi:hypothetical protein
MRKEKLLLILHDLGALLQLAQNGGQPLVDRLREHFHAMAKTGLKVGTAIHATQDITLHVVNQIDRLLLPCARLLQFVTNDVVAKKLRSGLWRETVEVFDHPVQMAIKLWLLTLAVVVPESIVHGIWWNVVTHHQWYGLLQQCRRLAGVLCRAVARISDWLITSLWLVLLAYMKAGAAYPYIHQAAIHKVSLLPVGIAIDRTLVLKEIRLSITVITLPFLCVLADPATDTHAEANSNDQHAGNRKGIVALYSLPACAPVDCGVIPVMFPI